MSDTATPREFDRAREPAPLQPRHYQFPGVSRETLANGLRVRVCARGALPLVTVLIAMESGGTTDPTGQEGLAWLTASLLTEGAGHRGAAAVAQDAERLGARLDAHCGWDLTTVRLGALKDKLPAAMELAADAALRPRFDEPEVKREVAQRIAEIQSDRDDPGSIAAERSIGFLFGRHRYGTPLAGTESTIGGMTPAALRALHQGRLRAGNAFVIFVGAVDVAEAHALAERHFAAWPAGAAPLPPVEPPADLPATQVHLVHKAGAVQSEIRVTQPGVSRDDPDYFPIVVMNAILGEAFGSRLFFNLRERHGFTYGVHSQFGMRRGRGPFVASSAVETAVTAAALTEFMREMRNIRDVAPTARELQDAKGYLSGGLAVDLQANGSVAERLAEAELYGLAENYMDTYRDNILAVKSEDVVRVARRVIDPEHMAITLVGDATQVESGLRDLYPVTVYDVMGLPR